MKRVLLYAISLMMTGPLTGQSQGQSLVTGSTDFVGLSGYPSSPQLVEAGPNSFYWISGSSYSNVYHPDLSEVYNDFSNLFFLKYDENGKVLSSSYIRGSNTAVEAVSSNGGLTIMARASDNVDASGHTLSLNGAYNMEFIAKYDQQGKYENMVRIWNLGPSESAYSYARGDKRDGSIYIYGTENQLKDVEGYGIIGDVQSQSYLYVLKYSPDLKLDWVYTAGFDSTVSANGFYYNLEVSPDIQGNVIISGTYDSNCSPLIGNKVLESHQDGYGLFAVKLDQLGEQEWVNEGSMKGFGYDTHIFKGLAMKNGDLIMAGVTTTGYFSLGDVEINIVNGSGFANQFVFRMNPDGTSRWIKPFQNMGNNFGEGKKGALSDEFSAEFYYDIIQWNDDVLYMCGSFLNESFDVAGRVLEKKYANGVFIAAVDLESGDELWGYGLSSDYVGLQGFDADGSGNVSLMGYSSENQDFEGLEAEPVTGTYPVFLVGLDYKGVPLWSNNATILRGPGYRLNGIDLEVLWNGDIFSSVYLSQADYLLIGGSSLFENYLYISWLVNLDAASELGGFVSDQSGNPVFPGFVRAYKSSRAGAFPMVDSVMLDNAGRYLFQDLYPGNYTLQVVPDPETYPEAIPTYLGDQVDWNDAQFNDFKVDTKVDFLDIVVAEVSKLTPEDGSGVMSGFVSYEEESALKGTLAKPVKKASVLVVKRPAQKTTNAEEVVAYVETDDLGNFTFEHVPDGDYLLLIDIAGLDMIETHEVNIVGNQIISGLDYTVGPDGIYTWTGVGIPIEETDYLKMFPNPGNGLIFMDFPTPGDYLVRIYGTDGRLVASRDYFSLSGLMTLDISEQNRGVYMIKIEGSDLSTTLKYIKR